jgi:NADPH2:quinone reductase
MRAVVLTKHGRPAILQISDILRPAVGAGRVRVNIETIGINYAEILSRKGLYGWAPKLPYILGMEAYGQIEAIGSGVAHRQVGEKVIIGTQYGSYAESIVVPEAQALPAIDDYSPEENAAFAVNYMTAWVSLFKMARLQPADQVLIQVAAGGVGTAAVQLAKRFGCIVYGTAGSDTKIERLYQLGIDHAINYRQHAFAPVIQAQTNGQGVDVILEMVGGDVYRRSLKLLAPFGRIVVVGFASLELQKWNPLSWWRTWRAIPRARIGHMAKHSYGVMASHLGYQLKDSTRMRDIWQDLTNFVHQHQIRPVIGAVLPFEKIAAAHELMESRQSYGKIVIRVR